MMVKSGWFWMLPVLFCAAAVSAGAGDAVKEGKLGYSWSATAAYPLPGPEAADATLRQWLEEHVASQVAAAGGLASANPVSPEGSWTLEVEYELFRPSESIASVLFTTFTHASGAAHPMTALDAVTIDLEKGKRLALADLFGKPETALAIMAENAPRLAEAALREEHPEAADDVVWIREGFRPTPENYACLVVEPDAVRVHFQRYQILPYVFGSPNIRIPLGLLEGAEPKPAVWPGR